MNCYGPDSQTVLRCLQSKSTREIISALELHLSDGNISSTFVPVDDSFLDKNDQFLGNPVESLRMGKFNTRMSFMVGQNEDDGSQIMFHLRKNLDRHNTKDLKYFVDNIIIPVSLLPYTLRRTLKLVTLSLSALRQVGNCFLQRRNLIILFEYGI